MMAFNSKSLTDRDAQLLQNCFEHGKNEDLVVALKDYIEDHDYIKLTKLLKEISMTLEQ
jgi:hypothetical protein